MAIWDGCDRGGPSDSRERRPPPIPVGVVPAASGVLPRSPKVITRLNMRCPCARERPVLTSDGNIPAHFLLVIVRL